MLACIYWFNTCVLIISPVLCSSYVVSFLLWRILITPFLKWLNDSSQSVTSKWVWWSHVMIMFFLNIETVPCVCRRDLDEQHFFLSKNNNSIPSSNFPPLSYILNLIAINSFWYLFSFFNSFSVITSSVVLVNFCLPFPLFL